MQRYLLDVEFRDHEPEYDQDYNPKTQSGYYNGYDVYVGGVKALFYPYDGSSWSEAFESLVKGLGEMLSKHMELREPYEEDDER